MMDFFSHGPDAAAEKIREALTADGKIK